MLKAERTLEHVEESSKKKAEGREARLNEINKLVDEDLEWLGENIANTKKTWEAICEGVDVASSVEEQVRNVRAPRLETDTALPAANPWADMTETVEDTKEQEGAGQIWWRKKAEEAKKADDWSQWNGHEWGASETGDGSQRADNNNQSHSSTHRGWESNSWDDKAWDNSHSADNSSEKPAKAASGQSSGAANPWADMTVEQEQNNWQASADPGTHGGNGDARLQEDKWQDGWQHGDAGNAGWQQGADRWKEEPEPQAGRWSGSNGGNSVHRHGGANSVAGSGDAWGAAASGRTGSGDAWSAGASGGAASFDAWGAASSDAWGAVATGVAGSNDAWGTGPSDAAAASGDAWGLSTGAEPSGSPVPGNSWGTGPSGAAASGDAWGNFKGVAKPPAPESLMSAVAGVDGRSWLAGGPLSSSRPLSGSVGSSIPGRHPTNQVNARNPQGFPGVSLPVRQPAGVTMMNQVNGPGNVAASSIQGRQSNADRSDPWTQGGDPWGASAKRPAVKSGQRPGEEGNPWHQMQHQ